MVFDFVRVIEVNWCLGGKTFGNSKILNAPGPHFVTESGS